MRASVLAAMLACGGLGCGGEAGPNGEGLEALVVSDPVPVGGRQVVYLSLPDGSIPQARRAAVTNRRTGSTLVLSVEDGGWKAAELEAVEGDTILVGIDQSSLVAARAVPEVSQPVVVRVVPPRGKRDVPLNARVYVAFSEPIDAGTVSPTSIRLVRDGTPVPGQVSVAADGLAATIDPDQDLAPSTDYQVSISAAVQDLDGDPAVPLVSQFSTGIATVEEIPDLQLDPSAADFGLAWVGGVGNQRGFRVWNIGLGTATLNASVGGPAASDYRITFDQCAQGQLAAYEQCTIQVTFAPSAAGLRNAVLLVGGASAALSGTAEADRLEVVPSVFDFGPVMAGRSTTATDFVATNAGTVPSRPLNAVMLGMCAPEDVFTGCELPFRIVNDRCTGRSLSPGASCAVSLEFRPDRAGRFAARFALTSRATATVPLDGEGLGLVANSGNVPTEPLTIEWGGTATLVIRNTGPERSGPITVPQPSGAFTISATDCSGTMLDAGADCSISLRFSSNNGQAASGLLELNANPGGTVAVYLQGHAR